MREKVVGIVGAGKLGITLAQLALKAGYAVYISGSGAASRIQLTVETLAPGAEAVTTDEVSRQADVIILAVPLSKFRKIAARNFVNKIIIDATNFWWEIDGQRSDMLPDNQSSSEAVQEYFSESRVVKAFSHMGYHHLHDEARGRDAEGRKAIVVAGDNKSDVNIVSRIVDDFGFDPLYIGPLPEGRRLEPGSPVFGANENLDGLKRLLRQT